MEDDFSHVNLNASVDVDECMTFWRTSYSPTSQVHTFMRPRRSPDPSSHQPMITIYRDRVHQNLEPGGVDLSAKWRLRSESHVGSPVYFDSDRVTTSLTLPSICLITLNHLALFGQAFPSRHTVPYQSMIQEVHSFQLRACIDYFPTLHMTSCTVLGHLASVVRHPDYPFCRPSLPSPRLLVPKSTTPPCTTFPPPRGQAQYALWGSSKRSVRRSNPLASPALYQ